MKSLKNLTFAELSSSQQDPTAKRRAKIVSQLQQQKALATDPQHVRTEYRWRINANGVKERVEEQHRVRPWWQLDSRGTVFFTVRYGAKAIEFEKGKAAIVLSDQKQLVPLIDSIIAAVQAGELDAHLTLQAKARSTQRKKAA